ncbi:MAG: GNAT family N-acetyltransferase [Azospirillaceae bacterium]
MALDTAGDTLSIGPPQIGDVGRIITLHATYYGRQWGVGPGFEARVAERLARLVDRAETGQAAIWCAHQGDRCIGSIAVDHVADSTALLNFFILHDAAMGKGLGKRLITIAIDHCRQHHMRQVRSFTFRGLDVARALYERHGFRLVDEGPDTLWGLPALEQTFETRLYG